MNKEFFSGKAVLVMGLGWFGGGVDAAEFLLKTGAKVTVTDLAPAEQLKDSVEQLKKYAVVDFHLAGHRREDFEQADIIVANPAVPADNEYLKIARDSGKIVTSQVNIFFQLCPAIIIGITGSNGKSTTAALTAHLLRSGIDQNSTEYSNVWLSGNIGNQPLLGVIDHIKSDDLVVLELSSFQIEQLAQVEQAPGVGLLTNLTPNHLDRYGTFADYCAAKENLFKFQKPDGNHRVVSIFCSEDEIGKDWFGKYKTDSDRICVGYSSDDVSKQIRSVFTLPGRANLLNLAGALAIARHFGVEDERIIVSLPEFEPLAHRLQLTAKIEGVDWYNDSVSTTPQSTIAALQAFDEPKIIIAGGYDKGIDFDELGRQIALNAKAAVLIGQTAGKIAESILKYAKSEKQIEMADSLETAVKLAGGVAAEGDVVLFSPGCASYDMFTNFQQRGEEFMRLLTESND